MVKGSNEMHWDTNFIFDTRIPGTGSMVPVLISFLDLLSEARSHSFIGKDSVSL